ncbi:hypothetical protein HZU77_014495 [Neisseriaceae bacterium TC5R-5]|nr:hypothetical protein [Neisseriaceae bacterium TC5R-5]
MGKEKQSSRENKKPAAMTAKEKKAKKQAKKNGVDAIQPFMPPR